MDYEGVSFDFSDGEYFDLENRELLYWLKGNTSFFISLKNWLSGNSFFNSLPLVPQTTFRYSVNAQRFIIYLESLNILDFLLERRFFFNSEYRFKQELAEVYSSYVFPFHKYYRKMFNVTFEDGPFSNEDSQDFLFPKSSLYNFAFDQDASSLFSEYDFDEVEEELLDTLELEYGYEEESNDSDIYPYSLLDEEENDSEFFDEEDIEEDWDDVMEEGIDFFIPGETPYSEKFLFTKNLASSLFSVDEFAPIEFSKLFKSEKFDDILLLEESKWISELIVDRFLINVSEDYDVSFEHDFLILAKISEYGAAIINQNILSTKSKQHREFYFKFFKGLKKTNIGFMTFKLKKTLGMVITNSDSLNLSNKYYANDVTPENDVLHVVSLNKEQHNFNNFDFNEYFINSLNKKRVYFVVHHPYSIDLQKVLNLKVYPIFGHQSFDNKFKRIFFKNPKHFVKILSLKNYPDLTQEEFQRLCLFLGCTKQEWDSVEKKKIDSPLPYNSLDFPLMLSLMMFFSQAKYWFRSEIMELRYYEDAGLTFFDRLFNTWWLNIDEWRLPQRQAYNELVEYDMPFITIYTSFKEFFSFVYEISYYLFLFCIEFSKGNVSSFYTFSHDNSYSMSDDVFYLLKYFYVYFSYLAVLWNYKYYYLFCDLIQSCSDFYHGHFILWLFSVFLLFKTYMLFINLDIFSIFEIPICSFLLQFLLYFEVNYWVLFKQFFFIIYLLIII